MKRRWQFRLASLFGVVFVVALLANLARLGHSDVALFLGGAILGSVPTRGFLASVIGGAIGALAVVWLYLGWWVFFSVRPSTPGSADLRDVPGIIPFVMASVAVGSLAIGGIVGGCVWMIKALWQQGKSGDR